MALNTVRLNKIRRLADSIFHDSNNSAFTDGIHACLHTAFVGITHYANPERMPALRACLCLLVDVPYRSCMMVAYPGIYQVSEDS